MDIWPFDIRKPVSEKTNDGESAFQFPSLDYGCLGAATLVQQKGIFQWTVLADNVHGQRLSPKCPCIKVFPETRPPPLRIPQRSIVHQAEQGAHFLRTYLPDVDVPAELIRKELEEDMQVTRDLDVFDPHSGNLLDTILFDSYSNKFSPLVLFPMGELNCELNISSFEYSKNGGNTVFKASSRPAYVFDTPIRQIAAPLMPCEGNEVPYVIVRTFASTSIMGITSPNSPCGITTTEVAKINNSDVGGRPLVDTKFLSAKCGIIAVNEVGHVYHCEVFNGAVSVELIGASVRFRPNASDSFFRLALSKSIEECLLIDQTSLARIDYRSDNPIELYRCTDPKAFVTAVEQPEWDNTIRLTTTSEILWLDDRFPNRPLLSYKHSRRFDRTLESRTVLLAGKSLTLLFSRRNGLVSVYDVSLSAGGRLYPGTSPYSLPNSTLYTSMQGYSILPHPSKTDISTLRLGPRGSLMHQAFGILSTDDVNNVPTSSGNVVLEWSPEVQKLDTDAKSLRCNPGPLGAREFKESDLCPAYKKIFATDEDARPECLIKGDSWHHKSCMKQFKVDLPDDWQAAYDKLGSLDLAGLPEPALRRQTEARDQLVLDLALSSNLFSEQPLCKKRSHVSQLDPVLPMNEPPQVHYGCLQPIPKCNVNHYPVDGEAAAVKEMDDALGVRLLLNEWKVGVSPEAHTYRDPYGESEPMAGPQKQTRAAALVAPAATQESTARSKRPPMVVAATSFAPPSQEDVIKLPVYGTQPQARRYDRMGVVLASDIPSSQEAMASTQVLPGPYGGRPPMKKAVKKRVGGF